MGKNLGSSITKDQETHKEAMSILRSIVKDLDSKLIPSFIAQVFETDEIGSESGGGYTVSLFVPTIMPLIIRTLSSSEGSLSIQQACSKAVSAIARYGIDPVTPEDKRQETIHAICKPLSDALLDTQHLQHLALGSSLCLKSLVDCDNWRFASGEMVNNVCQSLVVALEATSSEANSHMALVMALAKRNPFTVEAYVRLLVKSGLRILELGSVEGDSQKQVLAIQMLNFLMKNLNPKSMCSELEVIFQEMEKHQKDRVHHVKMAAYETLRTAERLIREADPMLNDENNRSILSMSSRDDESHVNDEEDDLFSNVASRRSVDSGSPRGIYKGYNQETEFVVENSRSRVQIQSSSCIEPVWFIRKSKSADFNKSMGSRTNRSRSSRRSTKKKQSQDMPLEHDFKHDSFSELLENRQKLQQCKECSSSSSSSLHDASGTTTPTDTYEKPKSDLDVEAKVKTGEERHGDDSGQVKSKSKSSKCGLGMGLSLFSVAVVVACFVWMQLEDGTPYLVPT